MGLFDLFTNHAVSALETMSGSMRGSPEQGAADVVAELLGTEAGLHDLIERFHSEGFGDVVDSWIGTGFNLPISPTELQSVLGQEQLLSVAQKLGMSPAAASNLLSTILPQFIDRLTPDGEVPPGDHVEQGLALLRSFGL